MKAPIDRFKKSIAQLTTYFVVRYVWIRSRLLAKQKIRILFSVKPDWRSAIENGFRLSGHHIAFDLLSYENIKNYDLVVPLTISDLKYLNQIRHMGLKNLIPIPSAECIELCEDKYLFNKFLIRSGFGNLIPRMGDRLALPYILKKRVDEWGANSHVISTTEEERELLEKRYNPEYFTQELIVGKYEYATHILFENQQITRSLTIKYAFDTETPIKGRDKAVYTAISHCRYREVFSSILESIGFTGICCINYKVLDETPWIFEINARIGGSLCPYLAYFIEHLV